jgi:hypothetical protein
LDGQALLKFRTVTYDLFDTRVPEFDDHYYDFRLTVKNLEPRLAAILSLAFDDCATVTACFKVSRHPPGSVYCHIFFVSNWLSFVFAMFHLWHRSRLPVLFFFFQVCNYLCLTCRSRQLLESFESLLDRPVIADVIEPKYATTFFQQNKNEVFMHFVKNNCQVRDALHGLRQGRASRHRLVSLDQEEPAPPQQPTARSRHLGLDARIDRTHQTTHGII